MLLSKSTECFNLVTTAKENYKKKTVEKLDDSLTTLKPHWSILMNFLGKKSPNSLPLIVYDSVYNKS